MGVLAAGTQVVISSYKPRSWAGVSAIMRSGAQQTQITGHSCQAAVILRSLQQTINTFNHFHDSFIHPGCRDFRIARSQVFTIKFCWKLPFYWEINKQGDGRASGMGARRYLLLHATHTRAWNEPSRSVKLYNYGLYNFKLRFKL